MSGYGNNYGGGDGAGYGATNPYASTGAGNRYDQTGGSNPYAQTSNPYAQQQQPAGGYSSRPEQGGGYGSAPQQTGGYSSAPQQGGGYSSRPAQGGAGAGAGAYGNDVEMQNLNGQAPSRDPNAILNECRSIDQGIEGIQRNLERLRFLQQRSIDDPDASQTTATNRELDALSNDTMTMYRNFGARIKSIKSRKESGDPRNRPQVGLVDRKLKAAINEYQQVDRDFRHKLAAQMERQYRIVRPDASDEEVREAVEDTSNNQVFSQALMQSNRRGQAQSALRAVQGRHEAIQKIERQMVELAQLFQDMETAVIEQEAPVQNIEDNSNQAVTNLGKGNEQLDTAVVKARSARKKKWICLGITILIILIIAAVIAIVVVITNRNK